MFVGFSGPLTGYNPEPVLWARIRFREALPPVKRTLLAFLGLDVPECSGLPATPASCDLEWGRASRQLIALADQHFRSNSRGGNAGSVFDQRAPQA